MECVQKHQELEAKLKHTYLNTTMELYKYQYLIQCYTHILKEILTNILKEKPNNSTP